MASWCAAHLAAGGVVDVGLTTEGSATQNGIFAEGQEIPAASGILVVRPSINAALEADAVSAAASYSPSFSLVSLLSGDITDSPPGFSVLNALAVRGDLRLSRVSLRAALDSAFGQLDPASAQTVFRGSNGASVLSLPYASLGAAVGASADVTRRFGLDVDTRVVVSSSLGDSTIPLTTSPSLDATASWDVTRTDALFTGASVQASVVEGRGSFVGGGPLIGWHKQLLENTGFELRGGVGAYAAEDDEFQPVLVYIPTASGRISTLLDLPGEAALEAGAQAGFTVLNDPLGTLLENRGSVGMRRASAPPGRSRCAPTSARRCPRSRTRSTGRPRASRSAVARASRGPRRRTSRSKAASSAPQGSSTASPSATPS